MSAEIKKEVQLEIAHVLFIDSLGYSKLLIHEQRALLETLKRPATAVQVPATLSYGLLKLHPQWDSLRGDPRFEEICRLARAERQSDNALVNLSWR
jgi:hypothetical protein